ncbi:hypothetical protein NESM_000648100 [Novymonas esmeraldas]|uniref:Uncharacterized protein n=1 Tax=Novymonas esmeraldas TaxID=1808958 RepID=A0AAW0ES91_9TRYP
MRAISALYRYACEEEGCQLHSELVTLFHGVDVAVMDTADADATANAAAALPPPPAALAGAMLLSYAPNLCFPTHITLSQSYLGDAGLAAFMRVLPMLRWVRAVEARGVGAGPLAVAALSAALTAHVVEGCEEAAALPLAADAAGTDPEPYAGGRLPALELVDLRDNDGIYALSGQRLLAALRKRHSMLRLWCAAHVDLASVVPALEVLVDLGGLPPSTAGELHAWNEEAANTKYQRQLAREARRWHEAVEAFTVRNAVGEVVWRCGGGDGDGETAAAAAAASRQAIGEHVIFRLSSSSSSSPTTTAAVRATDAAALSSEQITAEVNAHISDFLTAACCFSATDSLAATTLPTTGGVRAALQACIDFGADSLALLPHSNAALWYVARVWRPQAADVQQQQQGRPAPSSSSAAAAANTNDDVQLNLWEAKANVAALLRGLQTNPALEAELRVSTQAGGVVIERHLYRLRQLYVQLDGREAPPEQEDACTARVAGAGATPLDEMVALYYRVVAALVARRFCDDHLPSMRACEQHIAALSEFVLNHLVDGEESSGAIEACIERLCRRLETHGGTAGARAAVAAADDADHDTRVLPPVMARALYHLRRHGAEAAAWTAVYAGTAAAAAALPPSSLPPPQGPLHPFHACRCAEEMRQHVNAFSERCSTAAEPPDTPLPLPQPCTACCYRTLQVTQALLPPRGADAADVADVAAELRERWTMLSPVRRALPRELRMFLLDMVIRQRSRQRGGCAYVPALDAVAGVSAQLPESTLSWLACGSGQRERWTGILRAFGEWYRLRALESYGIAEARTLLHQPPA